MRNLTVREVATALQLTKRAVIYRLEKGQLKGTRVSNSNGVEEWRVYPNKEIIQALGANKVLSDIPAENTLDFEPEPEDILDVDDISVVAGTENQTAQNFENWRGVQVEHLETIVEKLVKPLAERLEVQAVALAERDRIIEDQGRQLRLLPDLEKRAEKERQEAELRTLESEALKKQVSALQDQIDERLSPEVEKQLKDEKAAKELELANLQQEMAKERQQRELELSALKAQLAAIDEYKKLAEEAKARLDTLQQTIEQRERREDSEKAAALEEVKRLQEEKAQETAAIREQLAALSKKLEKPEPISFWKRWFSWSSPEASSEKS